MGRKPLPSKAKAVKIAEFVRGKKAKKPVILDIRSISNICDYFVICSAETNRQTKAIYNEVLKKCEEDKIKINHAESDQMFHWILVDFFDVILHIFIDEAREFYNLEYLWNRAKKVKIKKI